ncbi:MAG: glycoside hydrolase family 127 protein [Chloroflexota bacterium]|nr:glycoside hydrolase family 127 protein [Chloroflexota bacterium]
MIDIASRAVPVVTDTSGSSHALLSPVPVDAVQLEDSYWAPRLRVNREVTLREQYHYLEDTGRLDNFRHVSGKLDAPFQGIYFNDSDVYKWLEAASWSLAAHPDRELSQLVEGVISEVAAAQQPDGYLNTYFTFERAEERWTNLADLHEMYCAGHLMQAAVAHHRATGSDQLLVVARRVADHICEVFGPQEEGKRPGTDGHEEIEMALVELYRTTDVVRYLRQAQFLLDVRGRGLVGGREYHQDHVPFRKMREIVGHAVRAVYLNAGAADILAETGDEELRVALERLWENMTARKLYVSGGLGSRYEGEAFGADYELPNSRAYAETCAAIGSVMWSWRMLQVTGEARYGDLLEHTLYNAVLPGVSLDGREYFYQNPLEDGGSHRRQEWFGCACCPPNVARTLASLPGYFYSVSQNAVWVHLYAEGKARIPLSDGQVVQVTQRTRYPWDGNVELEIGTEGDLALRLRIPAWCESGATLEVNGERVASPLPGTYAEVRREWRRGDTVRLELPLPVRRLECHPHVAENTGRVALMRGPILYCFEGIDHTGTDPRDVVIPANAELRAEYRSDLLGGVVVLEGEGRVEAPDGSWEGVLYRTAGSPRGERTGRSVPLTLVPYYAWANREPGAMRVWLRSR